MTRNAPISRRPVRRAFAGQTFPALAITLCAMIWGLYWLPLRAVEAMGVSGAWAPVVYSLPALAVCGGALIFDHAPCRGRWGQVIAAGLLAGAGLALYASGLVLTSVVRTTLLFYLTPIWSTLLGMALLGERPGPRRWIALTVAVAGLALTLGASAEDFTLALGAGEAMALASGWFWAGAAVMIRRMEAPPTTALSVFQYVAVIAIAAAAALAIGDSPPSPALALEVALSWVALPSLLMLGTLYLIFWGVSRMSPGRSGLLMMSEVVTAVISATILLPEEAMTATEWLGAALIIAAGAVEVSAGEAHS